MRKRWFYFRLLLLVAIIAIPLFVPGDSFDGLHWGLKIGYGRAVLIGLAAVTFVDSGARMLLTTGERLEACGYGLLLLSQVFWVLLLHAFKTPSLGVLFGGFVVGLPFLIGSLLAVVGNLWGLMKARTPNQTLEPTAPSGRGSP